MPTNSNVDKTKLFPISFRTPRVRAGFSLRNTNYPGGYTMRRAAGNVAKANIADFAAIAGFDVSRLVLPSEWPYGNRIAVINDLHTLTRDAVFGGLRPTLPADKFGLADSCEGLITKDPSLVLGVQNADCPMVFLYDPVASTIGVVHTGWKPVVRNVIFAAINQFVMLGSHAADIKAYVGPGIGDDISDFQDTPATRQIFAEYHRENLLDPANGFFRPFTDEAKQHYLDVCGQPSQPFSDTILAITDIIHHDLLNCGLHAKNIRLDERSSVLDPTLQSRRRDGSPGIGNSSHGLSLGFIRLVR